MKCPLVSEAEILHHVKTYEDQMTSSNIAAIGFDTTSVTLAYSYKCNKQVDVNVLVLNPDTKEFRVLNTILLRKNGTTLTVSSFGQEAKIKYMRMRANNDGKNFVYFDRIDVPLKREKVYVLTSLVYYYIIIQKLDRQTIVESFTGEKYYLVEVIAFLLKHLRDILIDYISRSTVPFMTTDLEWVITVPALWNAQGKSMMREAAYLVSKYMYGKGQK